MIFTAYPDENEVINRIQRFNSSDYVIIRLTNTMIDKNTIDANAFFISLVKNNGFVNYDELSSGGENGISKKCPYLLNNSTNELQLNFYIVTNTRGDRRFSITTIKKHQSSGILNEGDLLYFTFFKHQLYIINLTHNVPTDTLLETTFGLSPIVATFNKYKQKIQEILNSDFYPNSKGEGKPAPKDVGDTLEYLLGIQMNNRRDADIDGQIEIKSKVGITLDTLFTLRPEFDGTPVADYEKTDRNRVSAFARLYGYESEKHPGALSLYITIGIKEAPQNNQGFYLNVNENNETVELMYENPNSKKTELTAYWKFSDLREALIGKHPATLWFKAIEKFHDNKAYFKYTEISFSQSPNFSTFISLIKSGVITYDWRGYISKEGPYKGKNHGNAWRIRPKQRHLLFNSYDIDVIK